MGHQLATALSATVKPWLIVPAVLGTPNLRKPCPLLHQQLFLELG